MFPEVEFGVARPALEDGVVVVGDAGVAGGGEVLAV